MSSTCHANVARHIPKYRYGVLTPSKLLPLHGKRRVSAEGRCAIFHAVVSSVNKVPLDTVSQLNINIDQDMPDTYLQYQPRTMPACLTHSSSNIVDRDLSRIQTYSHAMSYSAAANQSGGRNRRGLFILVCTLCFRRLAFLC